jgi:hypothetical protein
LRSISSVDPAGMYSPILTQCLHRLVNTWPLPGSVYSVIDRTSSLPAGAGVIATALSISVAPSIDSATIRIVRLIIVLPGLSLSTMRKPPPTTLRGPRQAQTKEAELRHDETIVTNARILTL